MMHVALFQPEIPQNTGNIARSCALVGARLHLIRPLGFSLEERHLRRAGLDYWDKVDVEIHDDIDSFLEKYQELPVYLMTTKAKRLISEVRLEKDMILIFGSEGAGLPDALHERFWDKRLKLPMRSIEGLRSYNLSNSVAIALYEWWRQGDYRED